MPTIPEIYDYCRSRGIPIKGTDPCSHEYRPQYDIYEIGTTCVKTWYSCANCFFEKQQLTATYYTFVNGKPVTPEIIPDMFYKLYKCDCGSEYDSEKWFVSCSVCEKRVCAECKDIVDEVVYCATCTPTGKCEVCHVTDIENSGESPPWFCCDVCSRETCHNCCALVWCQCRDCICKKCFDCKCEQCGDTLEVPNRKDIWFCGDGDIEYQPLCKKCMININVDSKSR